MDLSTILIACLSSTGLFAFAQFLLNRYFKNKDGRDEIKKSLKTLAERSREGELNDSKTQLLILINHFPHDRQAILMEAENYFIKLQGDSWMAGILIDWAKKENVDIEYIKRAHEATVANLNKNKEE